MVAELWVPRHGPPYLLMLLMLCTPSAALASDFGCPAEWVDAALIFLSIPVGAAFALAALWLKPTATLVVAAVTWVALTLSIVSTTCLYGHDRDLLALGLLTAGTLLPALVATIKQFRSQAQQHQPA
jgi:hypothetical protein